MVRKRKCLKCSAECDEKTTVFRFPTDAAIRARWVEFCNIRAEEVKTTSWLCSLHFAPENFKHSAQVGKRLALRQGAIPSLHRKTPSTSQNRACIIAPQQRLREGEDQNLENFTPNEKKVSCCRLPKYQRGSRRVSTQFCHVCGNVRVGEEQNGPIRFFRFPADLVLRGKWLESLALSERDVNLKEIRICNRHFPNGDKRFLPLRDVEDAARIRHDVMELGCGVDVIPAQGLSSVGNIARTIKIEEEIVANIELSGELIIGHNLEQCESSDNQEQAPMSPVVNSHLQFVAPDGNAPGASEKSFSDTPAVTPRNSGTSSGSSERHSDRTAPCPKRRRFDLGQCESLHNVEHDLSGMPAKQNFQYMTPDGNSTFEEGGTSVSDIPEGSTSRRLGRPLRYFADFTISDLDTPRGKRRCLEIGRSQLSKWRSRVKIVQQQHRRLKKKLEKVEDALKTLQRRGLISECAADTLKLAMAKQ